MSNLIVFPVSFAVVLLFRKSRPRKKRESRIQAALKRNVINNETLSMSQLKSVDCTDIKDEQTTSASLASLYKGLDTGGRPDTGAQSRLTSAGHSKPGTPQSAVSFSNISIHSDKRRKKKCEVPWWGSIIAWLVLWAAVLSSAFFVTMYGIQFGDSKAQKWITSMVIAFFMSIFITQPIKVFLMAIIFSLLFKKADDENEEEEEDEDEYEIDVDEQWLHQPANDLGFGAAKPRKIAYKPPDASALEAARENRIQELKMYDILREITFYSFFLWILMVISYSQRDPNAYWTKTSLENHLTNPGDLLLDLGKARTYGKFWRWVHKGLVPGIRADLWYNGDFPFGQRGFVMDRVNRIMGFATMRQLRVPPNKCTIEEVMKNVINECNIEYSILGEDTRTFGIGWKPHNTTVENSADEYKWRSASELEGSPFLSPMNKLYGGGGYVYEMRGSLSTLQQSTKRLMEQGWIDKYTRALFTEFTVYNANVNLFTVVTILVEFPETGGVLPSWRLESINLLDFSGSALVFHVICKIFYMLFILFFLFKEGRKMWKSRAGYFKEFWNVIEFLIIILSIFATILYFYRFVATNELTNRFRVSHGNKYMKFQGVAYWDEVLTYLISAIVYLASIKFLRLLRFNRRMSLLASTLRYVAKSLMYFTITFALIFFAFVQFFYLVLSSQLRDWANFIYAAESCMQIILGKFDFYSMRLVSPIIPIIFFSFVVANTFILVNMFLSIIVEGFVVVKSDLSKQSNDYEMVDFMITRFKMWTGLGKVEDKPVSTIEQLNNEVEIQEDEEYSGFSKKMEKLLTSVSKIYFDADRVENKSYQETWKVMMKDNQLKSHFSKAFKIREQSQNLKQD